MNFIDSRSQPRRNGGLTLLEVLVSMAVLAVLLTTIYSGFTSTWRVMALARERRECMQAARVIVETMTRDIESMWIRSARVGGAGPTGLFGSDHETDGIAADRIDFTGMTHVRIGEKGIRTDLAEIGYFLQVDDESGLTLLYRRDDPMPDDDPTGGGKILEVARNLGRMNIRYRGGDGSLRDSWDSASGDTAGALPVLVEVVFDLIDTSANRETFSFRVHPGLAGTGAGIQTSDPP